MTPIKFNGAVENPISPSLDNCKSFFKRHFEVPYALLFLITSFAHF